MNFADFTKNRAKERLMKCKKVDREVYVNRYEDIKKELETVLNRHFKTEGEVKIEMTPIGKNKSYITAGVLINDLKI